MTSNGDVNQEEEIVLNWQTRQDENEKIDELTQKIREQKELLDSLTKTVEKLEDEIIEFDKKPVLSVYAPHIFVIFCIFFLIAKSYKTIL